MSALQSDLQAWCQSYVGAFSQFDAPAISRHWVFPNVVVQAGRRFSFASADDFTTNTEKLLGFYRGQGVVKAVRSLMDHLEMTPDMASISVADQMHDKDGGIIVKWQAAYVLQRTNGAWRAILASADGETAAWAARCTPLGGKT